MDEETIMAYTKHLKEIASLGNLSAENKTKLQTINKYMNALYDKVFQLEDENKRLVEENALIREVQKPLYSKIAQMQPKQTTPVSRDPEHTIIIKTNTGCKHEDTKKAVDSAIKNIRQRQNCNIKINKIIPTNSGVTIKIPSTSNVDDYVEKFNNFNNLTKVAEIYKPRKLDPIIVLKNVNKSEETSKIIKTICSINENLKGREADMTVSFASKTQTSTRDIVLRVKPNIYETIKRQNFIIYLTNQAVRVQKRVFVRQCQNCLCFNPDHKTSTCKNPKVCKTCGTKGDHTCTNIHKCGNCSVHPHFKDSPNHNHKPNNLYCPLYKAQMDIVESRTDYGNG